MNKDVLNKASIFLFPDNLEKIGFSTRMICGAIKSLLESLDDVSSVGFTHPSFREENPVVLVIEVFLKDKNKGDDTVISEIHKTLKDDLPSNLDLTFVYTTVTNEKEYFGSFKLRQQISDRYDDLFRAIMGVNAYIGIDGFNEKFSKELVEAIHVVSKLMHIET